MTQPLGRFIRTRREALKLTQTAFAAKLGIPSQFLSRWELGTRPVPEVYLPRLAKELGVSEACLRGLHQPRPRRVHPLSCPDAEAKPVECSIEEMVLKTDIAGRLSDLVRMKIGEAGYDELQHHFLRETPWELLMAHVLLADSASLAWQSPLGAGSDVLVVAEDKGSYAGHHLRLALVWEDFVLFPQVPVAALRTGERFRVDYLVVSPLGAVGVELDGDPHSMRKVQDARRTNLLPFPVVRFDNDAVSRSGFIDWLRKQIREKVRFGRAHKDAYRAFLLDRRRRLESPNPPRLD